MKSDHFSEVVMNVSSEIAWGDHQGQCMHDIQNAVKSGRVERSIHSTHFWGAPRIFQINYFANMSDKVERLEI